MVYIIVKPTRGEREAQLRESAAKSSQRGIRGVLRSTEEAYEVEREMAREGEEFKRPYAISGDSPESKRAEAELLLRTGINPETMEKLQHG